MKIYLDERGEIVTEEELKECYNNLKASGEFDGTFYQYIEECTGKNGTLTQN